MKKDAGSISICLKKMMFFLSLGLLVFLAACASESEVVEPTAVPEATPIIDEAAQPTAVPEETPITDETPDLEVNPEVIPDGEFVVLGTISAFSLIPQDKPLFKVMTENGQLYQILSQPVSQITWEDGTPTRPVDIKNGLQIRATVWQGEASGLGGDPVLSSSDLTILATD